VPNNYEKVITIKGRKVVGTPEQQKPPHVVKYSKPLARRKRSGIRFYDLGWIKDGDDWITISYEDALTATALTYNSDGTRNNSRKANPLTLADWQILFDAIFEIPVEEWAENYRQITEEHTQYWAMSVSFRGSGYSLSTASSHWSNGIFRPTVSGSGTTSVNWLLAFATLELTGAVKVTSIYDYSASAVPFTLSANCDIFLIPHIFYRYAEATAYLTGIPVIGYTSALNDLSGLAPRDALLETSHPYFGLLEAWNNNPSWADGVQTGGTYTDIHNLINYWKTYHPTRARQANRNGAVYTDTALNVADFAPSADWPAPPSTPSLVGYGQKIITAHSGTIPHTGSATSTPLFGRLFGVVRQGGQFYYFWED
jgi:hypothetical protein